MTETVVITFAIPNGDLKVRPVCTFIMPDGAVHRVTLHDHDWIGDFRGVLQAPDSVYRYLRSIGWDNPHGGRAVYESPKQKPGSDPGNLTVFEIDYDSVFGLDDCRYFLTNEKADCGGRVEVVDGQPICETCRNRVKSDRDNPIARSISKFD